MSRSSPPTTSALLLDGQLNGTPKETSRRATAKQGASWRRAGIVTVASCDMRNEVGRWIEPARRFNARDRGMEKRTDARPSGM